MLASVLNTNTRLFSKGKWEFRRLSVPRLWVYANPQGQKRSLLSVSIVWYFKRVSGPALASRLPVMKSSYLEHCIFGFRHIQNKISGFAEHCVCNFIPSRSHHETLRTPPTTGLRAGPRQGPRCVQPLSWWMACNECWINICGFIIFLVGVVNTWKNEWTIQPSYFPSSGWF